MLMIILIIIIVFIIFCSFRKRKCSVKRCYIRCNCGCYSNCSCGYKNGKIKCPHYKHESCSHPQHQQKEEEEEQQNLHEIALTPEHRGIVPNLNQPNHIMNRWKCLNSHPYIDSNGMQHTSFSCDLQTPIKINKVTVNTAENSEMHKTARFGSY